MPLNCGVGEDSWESFVLQEIKPVNPKGNQSWIFIGRTDAEAETPILWPPDAKSWLIGKDPDAGKDWRQEEKGTTWLGGWMASPTWWTWVWASSGRWWKTGKAIVLQSMGSQRGRHDWATEQQQWPLSWIPANYHCCLWFYTFYYFDTSYKWNHAIVVFLNGLFHLAYCPQASPVVLKSI